MMSPDDDPLSMMIITMMNLLSLCSTKSLWETLKDPRI